MLRLIFVFLMAAAAPAAWAATIPVTTTVDEADGSCGDGDCSLRDAVATSASGDTITIPAGHYVLTLGEIFINKVLILAGAGARTTVIDGNASSALFDLGGSANVELTDLSFVNGSSNDLIEGGAIHAIGHGGPLVLSVRRSTFSGNQSSNVGGAIYVDGPNTQVFLEESTFSDNHAAQGGAIYGDGDVFRLIGSNNTFSGNSASTGGALGGFFNQLVLFNFTIAGNQASGSAGGISMEASGGVVLTNTIVAGNAGGDCAITGPKASMNSIDGDGSCGLTGPGDLPGVNPLLGPLADNGGPTDTHALLAGSPAIDAGDNATCLSTDQRGVARPQGPACDIGAFEAQELTPQDQIAALIAQIQALVIGGTLAQNNADPLITKLESVSAKLDAGQVGAACNQLGAFINQLNAYISSGTLTPAQGQTLIDAAEAIQADLGC